MALTSHNMGPCETKDLSIYTHTNMFSLIRVFLRTCVLHSYIEIRGCVRREPARKIAAHGACTFNTPNIGAAGGGGVVVKAKGFANEVGFKSLDSQRRS